MSLDATWYGKAMQQERESDVHLKAPFVAGVYVLMAIGIYSFQLDPDVPVLTTAMLLVSWYLRRVAGRLAAGAIVAVCVALIA